MNHRHAELYGMTRERISFTFSPRGVLLSLKNWLAAVACTILERSSGFEPSSAKLKLLSFNLDLILDANNNVCHQFDLLSTDLHHILCSGIVETVD